MNSGTNRTDAGRRARGEKTRAEGKPGSIRALAARFRAADGDAASYGKLSFTAALELAAPHTWGASVVPVTAAAAISMTLYEAFSIPLFFSLTLTVVCLQSAVNTLNDLSDFISGVDRPENCDDPHDAAMVFHNPRPRSVLLFGLGLILLAFLCGLYALLASGIELILFGAAGVAVIILYCVGGASLSRLPLGEFFSGFTLGTVVMVASVYAYAEELNLRTVALSAPVAITIALIMLTNNASDIERDSASGRRTLPVLIGRQRALVLHAVLTTCAVAAVSAIVLLYFARSAPFLPLLIILVAFPEARILKGGLTSDRRRMSMENIMKIQWRLGFMYATMAAVSGIAVSL
jgi:1,4-dihydroxy-2-naphthoate octaprenyltransferase